MGNTNEYLTDNLEVKSNLDSSFGSAILLTGGTMTGSLTADASLILRDEVDISIFHLTIGVEGDMKVNFFE